MTIQSDYIHRASVLPPSRVGSRYNLGKIFKTAFIGILMLPAAVLAQTDICQRSNTKIFCNGNWGIQRADMPQVEGPVLREYLMQKSDDALIEQEKIPAYKLTPIQGEINYEIVKSMVKAKQAKTFDPCSRRILVAKNETHLNIIDGHHTATACRWLNGFQLATIIWDFGNSVLNELRKFPGVTRLNLDDSSLQN